jgi:hypothetical protein
MTDSHFNQIGEQDSTKNVKAIDLGNEDLQERFNKKGGFPAASDHQHF